MSPWYRWGLALGTVAALVVIRTWRLLKLVQLEKSCNILKEREGAGAGAARLKLGTELVCYK